MKHVARASGRCPHCHHSTMPVKVADPQPALSHAQTIKRNNPRGRPPHPYLNAPQDVRTLNPGERVQHIQTSSFIYNGVATITLSDEYGHLRRVFTRSIVMDNASLRQCKLRYIRRSTAYGNPYPS